MTILLSILVGVLFAGGLHQVLSRNQSRLIVGVVLLGQAANLLIFNARGLLVTDAPIIATDRSALEAPYADPLPQAMILTAIVISLAIQIFALVLVYRAKEETGSADLAKMQPPDVESWTR